ncbi:hypothetical protein K435DRAFT_855636 [Dendrothele bispora CBS 962.96]|uniref:Uncharacterized protein n=1 Tax=Dendrothele bispora (strain CBS 962.96) TaxID=1314807 RepID=A0A4S8MAY1_DENBC|nr:hypothetical protein K435DRAFT_855636 [Dendrothele bispora CBS 962.96]
METTDVIEEDTVTTSAAMSVPISIVVPASTVPTSCAISNRSLSFGEGLQEEDKVGGEEGKVEGAENTSSILTFCCCGTAFFVAKARAPLNNSAADATLDSLYRSLRLDKKINMISRPNLLTPPILLVGTMDGDDLRWPDSSTLDTSVSRSCLVDVPLSPFDLASHAQILQRISSCKQAQVKSKEQRTRPSTESEWISWKSEFSASTRTQWYTRTKLSSVPQSPVFAN